MRVSAKGRYGLQVMLELALRAGRGPVMVGLIAERQGLSAKYIHVLLGALKNAGLVRAFRGPSGGCELARDPARISVLDVILAVEGDFRAPAPAHGPAFAVEAVLAEAGGTLANLLARQSLKELAERQLAQGGATYCI